MTTFLKHPTSLIFTDVEQGVYTICNDAVTKPTLVIQKLKILQITCIFVSSPTTQPFGWVFFNIMILYNLFREKK